MKINIDADEALLAAVRAGVADAVGSPAFLRTLAELMAPELVWCTYEQARRFTNQAESTFDRWIALHREAGADGCPALIISTGLGRKEPRVRLDSLQAVMNFAAPALPPLNGAQLLPR